MTENYIKSQLMAGRSSDEIFSDFAEAMEKATKEYDEYRERKAKEEAKAKAKEDAAAAIMDAIYMYLEEYCGATFEDGMKEKFGGKEFAKLIDNTMAMGNLKIPKFKLFQF